MSNRSNEKPHAPDCCTERFGQTNEEQRWMRRSCSNRYHTTHSPCCSQGRMHPSNDDDAMMVAGTRHGKSWTHRRACCLKPG